MKKILLGLVLLIFVLSACASPVPEVVEVVKEVEVEVIKEVPAEPETSVFQKAQNGKPFRFTYTWSKDPFYVLMSAGYIQACRDYGLLCELHGVADGDEAKLVAFAEAFTAETTSGVLIPLNFESRFVQGELFYERGIPYTTAHRPVDRGLVSGLVGWAGPDPVAYGINAGKAAAEKVECQGPVAVSQSGVGTIENRVVDAFMAGFSEVCPDTEILERVALGQDEAKGIALSAAVLASHPDVTVAFSSCGEGAKAWVLGAQENGIEKGQIAIIGMDYLRSNLDMIKSGDIWMIVGQPIFEEGYWATALLANHLVGSLVPYENYLPAPQITLENADDFYAIVEFAESIASE